MAHLLWPSLSNQKNSFVEHLQAELLVSFYLQENFQPATAYKTKIDCKNWVCVNTSHMLCVLLNIFSKVEVGIIHP